MPIGVALRQGEGGFIRRLTQFFADLLGISFDAGVCRGCISGNSGRFAGEADCLEAEGLAERLPIPMGIKPGDSANR